MVRHLISAGIVLFFAVMMGMLVRDHILPWMQEDESIAVSMAQITDQWSGKDEWSEVSINGLEVGALRSMAQRNEEGFVAHVKFTMNILGRKGSAETAAQLNDRLELQRFRAFLTLPASEEPALELLGMVRGRTLHLKLMSESGTKFTELPIQGPLTLNIAADPFVGTTELVPGESYRLSIYDPLWGGQSTLRLNVADSERIVHDGNPLDAVVVESTMANTRMKMWLDENREAVRREIRIGLDGMAPAAEEPQSATAGQIVVIMNRIDAVDRMREYGSLFELTPVPELGPADFVGKDEGEPLQVVGFLPTLVQQSLPALVRQGNRHDE